MYEVVGTATRAALWAMWGAALVFGFVAGGCSSGTGTSYGIPPVGRVAVGVAHGVPVVTAHARRANLIAPEPTHVRVTISGADFGSIVQTVSAAASSAELLVPQGTQRSVQVVYLTDQGEILGTGEATFNVGATLVVVTVTVVAGVPGVAVTSTVINEHNELANQPFRVASGVLDNTNAAVRIDNAGHRFRLSGSLSDMSGGFAETLAQPTSAPFIVAAGTSTTYATFARAAAIVSEGLYQVDGIIEGVSSAGSFGIRTSIVPATFRLIHEHVSRIIEGDGTAGNRERSARVPTAQFVGPRGVLRLASGDTVVSDFTDCKIRLIQAAGTSTICGTGQPGGTSADGLPATTSAILSPSGMMQLVDGSIAYAETGNHSVRQFQIGGSLKTIAGKTGSPGFSGDGGPAGQASLDSPEDVIVQTPGGGGRPDTYLIADSGNNVVRRVDTLGFIQTVVGRQLFPGDGGDGGPPQAAGLRRPHALCFDLQGNLLIAQDFVDALGGTRGLIRKVSATGKLITTLAGSRDPSTLTGYDPEGQLATKTRVGVIQGIAVDTNGLVYFTEQGPQPGTGRVMLIDPEGFLRTVAGGLSASVGAGRPATAFALDQPGRIFFANGAFTFANFGEHVIEGLQ